MIEAQTIRDARGVEPIVLLDDVFAEFDAQRSARILELMSDGADAQAVFTAPKQSDVHGRAASLEHWSIAAGVVSR
jgi:recombinational DNA repair ATPase RecF